MNPYLNVPAELRLYKQWCCWRLEEKEDSIKPTKVPYSPRTHDTLSVIDSSTWGTFDEAVYAAGQQQWQYSGIGFVLSESDPFCFVDLDDPYELKPDGTYKHDDPQQVMNNQLAVYNEFNTYAERSPSGKGLHLICKGSTKSGRRRGSIEVYSNERYMTMTGDVYRNAPILDCNEQANVLWERLGAGKASAHFYAGMDKAKMSDEQVLDMAYRAANSAKFTDLFKHGNWQAHYPSQSEADFALVDILAFYSENRSQVQKLFLQSAIGQRKKSRAQYRINYMLNRCFDRMTPHEDIESLQNMMNDRLAASRKEKKQKPPDIATLVTPPENPYTSPPGLLGTIAHFIYDAAPRQVPEIALAGAIGLMAGICGRSYNVSGTGLNQYVLLLAATGVGKEAIASGIDILLKNIMKSLPQAGEFIGPAEIGSPQALNKYLGKFPSFVCLLGEFGLRLKEMSSEHAPPHMSGLRRTLLDLYNKSGEGKQLRKMIYSDKEKNIEEVTSPAVSLIGESTPEKFYECLNESMISEGLLPRFTTIEYKGDRSPNNKNAGKVMPSFQLLEQLGTICAHSAQLNNQHKAINVQLDSAAQQIADEFDIFCDKIINSSDREIRRQLWNRAHIKVLKLAALVAIGVNPYQPVIDETAIRWALGLITADVKNLLSRFDAGEIGVDNDEGKQISRVVTVVRDYVTKPWSELECYKAGSPLMHAEKIIPYSYLHRRLASQMEFKKDRMGATHAIKRSINVLVERGDMQAMSRAEMHNKYKVSAACYMVANTRVFGL